MIEHEFEIVKHYAKNRELTKQNTSGAWQFPVTKY